VQSKAARRAHSLSGPDVKHCRKSQRQYAGGEIADAGCSNLNAAVQAEEIDPFIGPALLDHERRADDGMATFEKSDDSRQDQ
jgi:hypothetical protein